MIIILIYIAFIAAMSLITFLAYFSDKRRAIRGEWRIRESVLLSLGFFGGAFGALLGMNICRHKIRYWYFWVYNIVFLIFHIVIIIVLLFLQLNYF